MVVQWVKDRWDVVVTDFQLAGDILRRVWSAVVDWFKARGTDMLIGIMNIVSGIQNSFSSGLNWVKTLFSNIFDGIKSYVKSTVNSIIGFINAMISAITSGVNAVASGLNSIKVTIPSWIPVLGGQSWGFNIPKLTAPQVPYLATGAVIPPNAAFTAVLGDQKSGNNIETPEKLMRQIVKEESQRNTTIRFTGTGADIARMLKPEMDRENRRVGNSLITGGTPV
jgi:hypothetical protein